MKLKAIIVKVIHRRQFLKNSNKYKKIENNHTIYKDTNSRFKMYIQC